MTQNHDINTLLVDRKLLACPKIKPITWSAVISGAMIAFGLTFLFHLLTIGIGLSIFSTNEQGIKELAFNGYIWTLVGGVIILFIAGWKTGKLVRICPMHTLHMQQPAVPLQPTLSETVSTNSHCYCSHGMTHGFLAWVLYLIISLIFMIFIAQAASVTFLKSTFLNIPMDFTQTMNQDLPRANTNNNNNMQNMSNQVTAQPSTQNSQTFNQYNQGAQKQNVQPITKATAQKVGVDAIALFLIFVLGAAACGIGSYLGVISHKKCLAKKCHEA
jgi:hypothetical protein